MTAPTSDEVNLAVALLWEIAEGKPDATDKVQLRRIARLIERQQAELVMLRELTKPKVAA